MSERGRQGWWREINRSVKRKISRETRQGWEKEPQKEREREIDRQEWERERKKNKNKIEWERGVGKREIYIVRYRWCCLFCTAHVVPFKNRATIIIETHFEFHNVLLFYLKNFYFIWKKCKWLNCFFVYSKVFQLRINTIYYLALLYMIYIIVPIPYH